MTKRKAFVWLLRFLAVIFTVGLPFGVISYKFPLWRSQGGGAGALGIGAVLIALIVFATFRKYIVAWASEKLGALSAGVSLILLWSGLAVLCLILTAITTILEDLATVFIFAAIGAAIGVGLFGAARRLNGKENGTDGKAE